MVKVTENTEYEIAAQACEWPNCDDPGEFKAPLSRDALTQYRWFCLAHVREYNRNWNYYHGMNEDEVEEDVRQDTVWHRPTWKLGSGEGFNISQARLIDPLGVGDAARDADIRSRGEAEPPKPDQKTSRALAVFDLEIPVNQDTVRARYKELVKRHHPDTNKGTKAAEEKFKQVTEAYEVLLSFLSP